MILLSLYLYFVIISFQFIESAEISYLIKIEYNNNNIKIRIVKSMINETFLNNYFIGSQKAT